MCHLHQVTLLGLVNQEHPGRTLKSKTETTTVTLINRCHHRSNRNRYTLGLTTRVRIGGKDNGTGKTCFRVTRSPSLVPRLSSPSPTYYG